MSCLAYAYVFVCLCLCVQCKNQLRASISAALRDKMMYMQTVKTIKVPSDSLPRGSVADSTDPSSCPSPFNSETNSQSSLSSFIAMSSPPPSHKPSSKIALVQASSNSSTISISGSPRRNVVIGNKRSKGVLATRCAAGNSRTLHDTSIERTRTRTLQSNDLGDRRRAASGSPIGRVMSIQKGSQGMFAWNIFNF